jgi:hypothetical protein
MKKTFFFLFASLFATFSFAQKIETVYLNPQDSSSNMYIAVLPEKVAAKALLVLLDGFGASPKNVLIESDLAQYAAKQGILTTVPLLKTGPLYFGSDNASQQSLREHIQDVVEKYHLQGKDIYIGGFSIGGTCAVMYAELAVKNNYVNKPKAVFAVDPPLDWEHFYNAAKRIVRLSTSSPPNSEVVYMIDRIEKEMNGNPKTALENFYRLSPYSFSDSTQTAIKNLVNTPTMFITEPDIQWWLSQRGYDYDYINVADLAAMINELQRLGNKKAVLVTTTNKGYRQPGNTRHPHSWSIVDKKMVVDWLLSQK